MQEQNCQHFSFGYLAFWQHTLYYDSIPNGFQDYTNQPLLLVPKILSFPKELESHPFSISIQEIYVFPHPFETYRNGRIPFLIGTHTRFITTKKDKW
jgi:hypothetical protein